MIRIVIVDDQEVIRDSLNILLSSQEDFQIVGIGKDGYDAIRLVDTLKPDVVLLDVRMPIIDGAEATLTLKHRSPSSSIIILTTFDDDEYVLKSIRNGASGYLLKSSDMNELATAIRTVNEGGSLMTPGVMTKAFRLFSDLAKERTPPKSVYAPQEDKVQIPSNISRTEMQIVTYIGQGLSNKEIAKELSLREGTVRNYISSILQKTDLRDRTQVAIYAIKNGLVEIDEK
ncbi:response regulator transcription factor [Breznakiella homolactica]|uniref:Response regulator transcription factor n=1 Tax=Breznakiella homolactica TaxID=2798577 RepID=A0A7T7XP28_9SPIR|nr:response regulator transcription factor [Breznakiella homolactica]QQO09787.1 response regulator transcription factor [Breznakiella homolactica]